MRKITIKVLTKLPTRYGINGLILIVVLFIYGVVGSYFIMNLSIVDSIYYTIITMTTVGYGDYIPTTGVQKIFASTLAFGGVILLAYVFNVILTNFQEKMSKYSKGARKMNAIDKMKDYYIICGYGRVGKVVFEELNSRNQNIIVIEKDKEKCERIKESSNVVVINDEATKDDLIVKLACKKCSSVILCTGDDVSNLFIVLTIREINPDVWIVSRASKIENIKRLKKAGADKVVSPEIIGGKDLYFESSHPHSLRITVKHPAENIFDEFETITKFGCTLENVDYHIPGIEKPLSRPINTRNLEDGKNYKKYLDEHEEEKQSLINLYKTVKNMHSHLISGPDQNTLDKLLKELEKQEEIIGINLNNKEIVKLTKKEIKKD